jgi:hypothetical protein
VGQRGTDARGLGVLGTPVGRPYGPGVGAAAGADVEAQVAELAEVVAIERCTSRRPFWQSGLRTPHLACGGPSVAGALAGLGSPAAIAVPPH